MIQCLARCQRTSKAVSALRMVSPLTWWGVMPSLWATSATSSSVQTLVGLPKVRGLWCNSARNCARRAGVKTAWGVRCGAEERGQDGEAVGIKGMDDIAHGLVVTAEALANQPGMFAPRTGAQDLTAAEDKGIGRTEAGIDGLLFGVGEGADKNWSSHTRHDTTFPTMLLETALGVAPG